MKNAFDVFDSQVLEKYLPGVVYNSSLMNKIKDFLKSYAEFDKSKKKSESDSFQSKESKNEAAEREYIKSFQ